MKDLKIDPAVIEYIAEGKEIIEKISKNLSLLEKGERDQEILGSLYRDVHTLKGSSQLFGFRTTAQIAHALEASLDPVRKGKMSPNSDLIDACIKTINLLEKLISSIESMGRESYDEIEVIKYVSQLVEAATSNASSSLDVPKEGQLDQERDKLLSEEENSIEEKETEGLSMTTKTVQSVEAAIVQQVSQQPSANVQQDSTIRVNVSLLDRILNLVGELVLIRNQLVQHRYKNEDPDFLNTSKSLDVVTSDLQGEIMKTRMQPIETVVGKFQRVVRDIARDLGKQIDLTLEGAETELDRSLLEAIKDPLTHIVRNSCDHGIESPDDRRKVNKPDTGHLLIRSYHEGGQVVIEVSDDGRGINRQRVVQKAIEKGLLTADKGSKLSDREICELIFLPGFSTAQQVTSVSGRGVGMDVVKTNIEKIGGTVEIKSVEGKGTSLQLRIPLTLAIVPALIIRSGSSKFAIPQVKLVELVRTNGLSSDSTGVQMEMLQGRPTCRLRGQLLPLYDVREVTGEKYDSTYKDGAFIVVLNADGEHFGLLVSEVLDTADIVVKPMSSLLNNLQIFSGATILGDGSIALILDIQGLSAHGNVLNKKTQKDEKESFSKQERSKVTTDAQEFLMFSLGTDALHSLPLCLVNRLEEFSLGLVEQSGEQRVVRYRDGLLPLIGLSKILNYETYNMNPNINTKKGTDRISVIVIQKSGRNYGLVVDDIVDVMTIEGQIDDSIRDRSGILGNLIYKDEVIVVIDALGIVEDFHLALKGKAGAPRIANRDAIGEIKALNKEMKFKSVRILYAEDVAFFRRHVSKVLAEAGIDVTTVEDGKKAIQELEASEEGRYNLVLSDIEMPNLNGYELARAVRNTERFRSIPMIALTTRFRDVDIQEGRKAGFNAYLEKLNPEKLLNAIQELMGTKTGAV